MNWGSDTSNCMLGLLHLKQGFEFLIVVIFFIEFFSGISQSKQVNLKCYFQVYC